MASGEKPAFVAVGRIHRPHGVKGEVVVEVLSDNPSRFEPGSKLLARREGDRSTKPLEILSSRPHRGVLLVLFEGFEERDEAAGLRGVELLIASSDVAEAPDGEYYFFDLVGCVCIDRVAGELGEVISIREDGGGLLLEVRDRRRTVLVPFVRDYIRSVAIERKVIELDLPDGLLEICASPS